MTKQIKLPRPVKYSLSALSKGEDYDRKADIVSNLEDSKYHLGSIGPVSRQMKFLLEDQRVLDNLYRAIGKGFPKNSKIIDYFDPLYRVSVVQYITPWTIMGQPFETNKTYVASVSPLMTTDDKSKALSVPYGVSETIVRLLMHTAKNSVIEQGGTPWVAITPVVELANFPVDTPVNAEEDKDRDRDLVLKDLETRVKALETLSAKKGKKGKGKGEHNMTIDWTKVTKSVLGQD